MWQSFDDYCFVLFVTFSSLTVKTELKVNLPGEKVYDFFFYLINLINGFGSFVDFYFIKAEKICEISK